MGHVPPVLKQVESHLEAAIAGMDAYQDRHDFLLAIPAQVERELRGLLDQVRGMIRVHASRPYPRERSRPRRHARPTRPPKGDRKQ